uniref:CSON008342 protein n=1 Tax=Culicoides sonorensis TaxID=179676 RepID=A0A336MY92_CULSO
MVYDQYKSSDQSQKFEVMKSFDTFPGVNNRKSTLNWNLNNDTFSKNLALESITIILNIGSVKADTFDHLEKLTHLTLSKNNLKAIDVDFPDSVLSFTISNNQLNSFETPHFPNLTALNLTVNNIHNFTVDLEYRFPKIITLDLSNNPLEFLSIIDKANGNNSIKFLHLQNTLLKTPEAWTWTLTHFNSTIVHLNNTRPWCDCETIHIFQGLYKEWKKVLSYTFLPQSRIAENLEVLSLLSFCRSKYNGPVLFALEDFPCYNENIKKEKCRLYAGHVRLHKFMNKQVFFLDCTKVEKKLNLDNETIQFIFENDSELKFSKPADLYFLLGENNLITTLPNLTELIPKTKFNSFEKTFYIHAEHSKITKVFKENLPENLTELFLANNRIEKLDPDIIDRLTSMNTKTTLKNNPLKCECSEIKFHENIIKTFRNFILDFDQMTCSDGEAFNSNRELCISPWTILLYLLIAMVTVIAIGLAFYLRNSLEIQVFIYSRGWFPAYFRPESDDAEYQFDVFLSFSEKDDEFASSILKLLEEDQDPPFKVCYHHRDWMVGERIDHQIISSVEESRKTVIIISQSFLSSHWANMEFTTAHYKMLEEKSPKILLILHVEINTADLGPELKSYIKTTTYLKSDDKWFEKKLLYALRRPKVEAKKTESDENVLEYGTFI